MAVSTKGVYHLSLYKWIFHFVESTTVHLEKKFQVFEMKISAQVDSGRIE